MVLPPLPAAGSGAAFMTGKILKNSPCILSAHAPMMALHKENVNYHSQNSEVVITGNQAFNGGQPSSFSPVRPVVATSELWGA